MLLKDQALLREIIQKQHLFIKHLLWARPRPGVRRCECEETGGDLPKLVAELLQLHLQSHVLTPLMHHVSSTRPQTYQ